MCTLSETTLDMSISISKGIISSLVSVQKLCSGFCLASELIFFFFFFLPEDVYLQSSAFMYLNKKLRVVICIGLHELLMCIFGSHWSVNRIKLRVFICFIEAGHA